jgi:hypothetical protein
LTRDNHLASVSLTLTDTVVDLNGIERLAGTISGTGIAPPASPTFTGTVTLPAAVSAPSLPTADPHVVGRLWANSGVVTVSAG